VTISMRSVAARLGLELRILPQLALGRDTGIWAKLPIAFGLFYLVGPLDLIPRRTHSYGFLDEVFFLLGGLFLGRLLAPAFPRPRAIAPGLVERLQFRLRILQADLGNFYLLQHRREDGFVITAKNSGSHWLKFMLNNALARQFGLPPPPCSTGPSADYIAGRPGRVVFGPGVPHFATSHTIPSGFFALPFAFRLVPARPVVVLVREIGEAVCSNYLKWRDQYRGTLQEYVQGDPTGRRHIADVWWYVHFFNRWGDVAGAHPGLVLIMRYEDLRAEPERSLRAIAAHLGVPLSEAALAAGLAFYGRDAMRARRDTGHAEAVIPDEAERAQVRLSLRERMILHAVLARHLRHDPGYGYPTRAAPAARSSAARPATR